MQYRTYSRRILCPFHGMLQVVCIDGGMAESTDGFNWRLYVADERIVSHTGLSEVRYGTWNPKNGRARSKVRGTSPATLIEEIGEKLITALTDCAHRIPFPQADHYEYWLFDDSGKTPLALLNTAIESDERIEERSPRWHPGAAAKREFSSDHGSAEDLAALLAQAAGPSAIAAWVHRQSNGESITEAEEKLPGQIFPETLLLVDWAEENHTMLVRDFVSWQAPWLLQLDTLRLETRAWPEQAAWLRPNENNRVFRLLPRILDQKGLIATRIKAQLIRESDKTDVVAEAFYPSLSD